MVSAGANKHPLAEPISGGVLGGACRILLYQPLVTQVADTLRVDARGKGQFVL